MRYSSFSVIFIYFDTPSFDFGLIFRGDAQPIGKSFVLNLLKKKIKNNHYSGNLLDLENWWCILAQFEKFKQIWGTVKAGLLNLKNKRFENSICLKKMHISEAAGGAKFGVKWPICPSQQQGSLLEISYMPL